MDLIDSLEELARFNRFGVAFLFAYALTWTVCAALWRVFDQKVASLATLLQGGVAFPISLGIAWVIGIGGERPVDPVIDQLSALVAGSQALALPFLMYLFIKERYLLIPFAFASLGAMHFVYYAWLYRTPHYLVMSIVLAVGVFAIMMVADRHRVTAKTASTVCFYTGLVLVLTGVTLLV